MQRSKSPRLHYALPVAVYPSSMLSDNIAVGRRSGAARGNRHIYISSLAVCGGGRNEGGRHGQEYEGDRVELEANATSIQQAGGLTKKAWRS